MGKPNPKTQQVHLHDNYASPDYPPQDVDTSCHLSDSTSTTDSLDESSTLSAPEYHLLQVDSTSPSFKLQDTSSVEIEFDTEFEEQLDHGNLSPTDVFLEHYDYELFLLNQEIDTPYDNLCHQETHNCEQLCKDDPFLTHATNLSLTFAIPHFMAQHSCEDLNLTDTPITVPILTKAYSGHALSLICAHNPFASQVYHDKSSNSIVSPCLNSGDHLLKEAV